jgi:hypothetical protein
LCRRLNRRVYDDGSSPMIRDSGTRPARRPGWTGFVHRQRASSRKSAGRVWNSPHLFSAGAGRGFGLKAAADPVSKPSTTLSVLTPDGPTGSRKEAEVPGPGLPECRDCIPQVLFLASSSKTSPLPGINTRTFTRMPLILVCHVPRQNALHAKKGGNDASLRPFSAAVLPPHAARRLQRCGTAIAGRRGRRP